MTDLDKAIAAAREAQARFQAASDADGATTFQAYNCAAHLAGLLAALDAARGQAVAWFTDDHLSDKSATTYDHSVAERWRNKGWPVSPLYAAPPAALAVPADNVTPMRQPRADLARLVDSINAAVYANGDGLSVTEAIGALELAKLELLKEQEQ